MKNGSNQQKGGKKTVGSVIITAIATIIVIVASLFGFGGEENEQPNSVPADSQVVSESQEESNEDLSAEESVIEEEGTDVTESASDEESESIEENVNEEESDSADEVVSEEESISEPVSEEVTVAEITFRNQRLLDQHYDKHGIEMGFDSAEEYELAAYKVIIHPDTLHKIEAEDGDDVYYLEATNEFVVVSQDGYIRTYFKPSAGIDYYNRQ